jgi:hypothetical protein
MICLIDPDWIICEACGTACGVDVNGLTGEIAEAEPDWGVGDFCGPAEYANGTNNIEDKIKVHAALEYFKFFIFSAY